MFINKQPVPVTDGANTIFIKPKMDFGTRNAVIDEAMSVAIAPTAQKGGKRLVKGKRRQKTQSVTQMHVGAYQVALLVHNIVNWSGPAFLNVPCTAEAIRSFDPDAPLLKLVQEEIAARNPNPEDEEDEEGGDDEGDVVEGKSTLAG